MAVKWHNMGTTERICNLLLPCLFVLNVNMLGMELYREQNSLVVELIMPRQPLIVVGKFFCSKLAI